MKKSSIRKAILELDIITPIDFAHVVSKLNKLGYNKTDSEAAISGAIMEGDLSVQNGKIYSPDKAKTLEEAIRFVVGFTPMNPKDIFTQVKRFGNYRDSDVRNAIWHMTYMGELIMTRNRQIRKATDVD